MQELIWLYPVERVAYHQDRELGRALRRRHQRPQVHRHHKSAYGRKVICEVMPSLRGDEDLPHCRDYTSKARIKKTCSQAHSFVRQFLDAHRCLAGAKEGK